MNHLLLLSLILHAMTTPRHYLVEWNVTFIYSAESPSTKHQLLFNNWTMKSKHNILKVMNSDRLVYVYVVHMKACLSFYVIIVHTNIAFFYIWIKPSRLLYQFTLFITRMEKERKVHIICGIFGRLHNISGLCSRYRDKRFKALMIAYRYTASLFCLFGTLRST